MKLAEALALRADLQRRIEQLRSRIIQNARYQEGEPPAEDATDLLAEAERGVDRLRLLISAINTTNAAIDLGADGTMTEALAARDTLRLHHSLLTAAADAASPGGFRQMRSELRQIAAFDVADVRTRADEVARRLRELDGRIQQANWLNDLREEAGVIQQDD
ncbi:DIP1984 family protein [Microbacterium sp. ZW T5_56]|uniref:DIP1984 family protein n=1 Tax=Microbacterium sp. ZW T5_56 TaxID=3378081 RepID=UPI0038543D12